MICGEKYVSLVMLLCVVSETAEQVHLDVQKWFGLPTNLSYTINGAENDKREVNTDCPVVFQNSSTVVMSPHHPFQYPAGMCCDWIIHAPQGQVFDFEIIVLDLPAQTKGRCLNGYLAFGYFDFMERRIGGYSEVCGNLHPDVNLCKLGKEKVWVHFCSGDTITESKDPYSGFLLRLKLTGIPSLKTDIEKKEEKMNKVMIGASIMSVTLVLVASIAGTILFIRLRQKHITKQHQRRLTSLRMGHASDHMIADPPDMSDEEQVLNSGCPNIVDQSQMSDSTSMDHFYESIQERYSLEDHRPYRFTSLQFTEATENADQDSFTSVFSESASYFNRRSLPLKPILSYITFIGTASRLSGSNMTLNDSLSDCCTEEGPMVFPNNDEAFYDSSDQKDFSPEIGLNQQEVIQREKIPSLSEHGSSLREKKAILRDHDTRTIRETIPSPLYGPRSNPVPVQRISFVRRYPRKRNRTTSYDDYRSLKKAKKIIPKQKQTKSNITSAESGDTSQPTLSEFTSTPKDFELMGTIRQPLLKPVPKINIFFPSNSEMDISVARSNYLSSISSLSSGVSSPLQILGSSSYSLMVPKWKPAKQVKERCTFLPHNNSTGARRLSEVGTSSHKSSATSLGTIEEEKMNS
ncbi:hypothetical protein ACJMK2_012099 [Sinanodonta woodiana]|uniref:CUB domain-containing protein n=1 Tax=Sinanodonta woodiana TaxID=1069815 RepID=A0ABD3V733_SINWO